MQGVYLSDDTSYLGKALSAEFKKQEVDIFQKTSEQTWQAVAEEGVLPSVFVVNLNDNIDVANEVFNFLREQTFEEETLVLGISTIMTWGKTNKDSKKALKETRFKNRKCSVKYKDIKTMETIVQNLKKENLSTAVIAPGILYGNGENAFQEHFKDAWLCEKKQLNIIGDGRNLIPTIHVKDLSSIVATIASSGSGLLQGQQFVVAVDNGSTTQADIVTGISKSLGNGAVTRVPAMDESVLLDESGNLEILTTDMRVDLGANLVAGLENITWVSQEGFVDKLPSIQKEFISSRNLRPLRIYLHGAPGAGKTHYASRLAADYYLPHIHIKEVIREVREGPNTELKQKVLKAQEDEKAQAGKNPRKKPAAAKPKKKSKKKNGKDEEEIPRVPTELVTEIMRQKLRSAPCRNKGYVLDGYPRTLEEAKALFAAIEKEEGDEDEEENKEPEPEPEEGEEGVTKVSLPAFAPEFVLSLGVSEETAAQRNRDLFRDTQDDSHNDEEGFQRRWKEFNTINDPQSAESQSPLSVFEGLETLEITEELGSSEAKALSFIGIYLEQGNKPYNYHPTEAEAADLKQAADKKAAEEAEQKKQDEEGKEKVETFERESSQLATRLRRDLVLGEDQELVEAASLPLRRYLMSSVVPALVDGLLDVCRVQPQDPIDYLAEYMFNYATVAQE